MRSPPQYVCMFLLDQQVFFKEELSNFFFEKRALDQKVWEPLLYTVYACITETETKTETEKFQKLTLELKRKH